MVNIDPPSRAAVVDEGRMMTKPWLDQLANIAAAIKNTLPLSGGALNLSASYANDAAAATGGVAIGSLYRSGSTVSVRIA